MNSPIQRTIRTIEEFKSRVGSLTRAELRKLQMIARLFVPAGDVDDLVQQSCLSVLNGRAWPSDVEFFVFMTMTMRSVASSNRSKMDRRSAVHAVPQHGDPVDLSHVPDSADSPENLVARKSEYEATMKMFENDEKALTFIEAKSVGFDKRETMELCGVDETGYDTITKRIRRALARRDQRETLNG